MHKTYRKIHLDFHTHPEIRGVCQDFDPDRFAGTLADAGVDDVVLFAKDHYGHAFFRSEVNAVHPHLETEFLPLAADACRRRGIHTEAYISVCCDYVTFQAHEDWSCRNADGSIAQWSEALVLLDLASPLLEQVVIPFTEEVVRRMAIDGLWFDIVMYPNDGLYSAFVTDELKRRGLADTPEDRGLAARAVAIEAQRRLFEAARAVRPDIDVLFNNQAILGDTLAYPYNDCIEIESDPSHWPQYDLPLRCRYIRGTGKFHHGLTTRFHRCWGDFGGLQSPVQLQFEIGNILAAGSPCVSLGDHLHPRGKLEGSVYRLIGGAYEHCKRVAPLVDGAAPLEEVALLVEPCPAPYNTASQQSQTPLLGATRALIEEHVQFSVRDAGEEIPEGVAMLLPGGSPLPPDVVAKVKRQVAAGRALLAFGDHVLGFEDLAGCGAAEETGLAGQHLLFENLLADEMIGDTPHAVYGKVRCFAPGEQTEVIARTMDPLFDETLAKTYHGYGPADYDAPPRPAIVATGGVILCGVPLPQLVHTEGAWALLTAMGRLLRRLVPEPLVATDAGATIEVALHRKDADLIVHLVASRMPRYGTPPVRMRSFEPVRGVTVHVRSVAAPSAVVRVSTGDRMLWDTDTRGLRIKLDIERPHEVLLCRGAAP